MKVLSLGRERRVILEAAEHDKDCVLANILAAQFLSSSDSFKASLHIQAAKSRLVNFFFVFFFFLGPCLENFQNYHKRLINEDRILFEIG